MDDVQLRAIRAASVSGDWRPINGNLELVAVCAVNVPGFPIPRTRVASGQPVALVAAGTEELVRISMAHRTAPDTNAALTASLLSIDERIRQVEDYLLNHSLPEVDVTTETVDIAAQMDELRARVYPEPEIDVEELRARVHGTAPEPEPEPEIDVNALRDRIRPPEPWGDEMPMEASLKQCVQASLRARVASGVAGTATSHWKADKRDKAAKSGVAMSDGSFPIADKKDWDKARRALGRAKNRAAAIRHIKKRGRTLGIAKEKVDAVWRQLATSRQSRRELLHRPDGPACRLPAALRQRSCQLPADPGGLPARLRVEPSRLPCLHLLVCCSWGQDYPGTTIVTPGGRSDYSVTTSDLRPH